MKKLLTLLCAIALMAALVWGCTTPDKQETAPTKAATKATEPTNATEPTEPAEPNLGTSLSVYPLYDTLSDEDKIIWDNICTAIQNHSTEWVHIGTYTGVAEIGNAEKRIGQMYRELVYACPDYFWVNLYDFEVHSTKEGNATHVELELKYILDEETARNYKAAYDARVNEIVTAAQQIPDLFDRILYVYDTIIANVEYDHDLPEVLDHNDVSLSAYGCLVEGKTVCSGYALAFRSIMEKLGIECGVEFNSYQYYTGWSVGHVWNYCKLEDEYYYFDLTWDDTNFGMDDLISPHLFFAITREDLELASYYLNEISPVPECNGTKYNYFRYLGLNFPTYDYSAVKSVIQDHRNDSAIILRFDSREEMEKAEERLIEGGDIFRILPELYSIRYLACSTDLHLMLLPD